MPSTFKISCEEGDPIVFDGNRLASFKTSLLNLRDAMKQRQNLRKSGAAESESTATAPPSAFQRQSSSSSGTMSPQPPPSSFPNSPAAATTTFSTQQSAKERAGNHSRDQSFLQWLNSEREGLLWILACAAFGALLGFAVGVGWLTRGAGTYQYAGTTKRVLGAMSAKTGSVRKRTLRRFVVSAWRVDLAKRVRATLVYQLITLRKAPWRILFDLVYGIFFVTEKSSASSKDDWLASSMLWPPNWLLFREVDLSQVEVGDGGLGPFMVSTLSFILPWRRNLIKALARKDRVKVKLRDQDGNIIEPSSLSSLSSSSPSTPSSAQSNQPINPYYHPMAFHTLREYIIRFDNGYVHPDLGFLVPAPSGELVFTSCGIALPPIF